jgi:hypothetical protein
VWEFDDEWRRSERNEAINQLVQSSGRRIGPELVERYEQSRRGSGGDLLLYETLTSTYI